MSERETAQQTNAFEDDEPSSVPEGTLDAWSAPLRKPVVPKILSTDDFYALLRILEVLPADPFLSALQSKLSDEERRQHGNQASHLSGPEFVREIERIEALIHARLVAAGADPVPVCQWREIATAPKDADLILLYQAGEGVRAGYWDTITDPDRPHWFSPESQLITGGQVQPTHWMPLPERPKVSHE